MEDMEEKEFKEQLNYLTLAERGLEGMTISRLREIQDNLNKAHSTAMRHGLGAVDSKNILAEEFLLNGVGELNKVKAEYKKLHDKYMECRNLDARIKNVLREIPKHL